MRWGILTKIALAATVLFVFVPVSSARAADNAYTAGKLIVEFSDNNIKAAEYSAANHNLKTGLFALDRLNEKYGVSQMRKISVNRSDSGNKMASIYLLDVGKGTDMEKAAREYAAAANVEFAEPDYQRQIAVFPNDARFNRLWGLRNTGQTVNEISGAPDADIDAPDAWDLHTGSSTVTVAVIDTGVSTHPDLANRLIAGWDFVNNDNTAEDLIGHGTHVAGIIGATGNNGVGVTGVSWGVKIMPLKVSEDGMITSSRFIAAVNYAIDHGVDIINFSATGSTTSKAERSVIAKAGEAGILFVTAAGNNGTDNTYSHHYPSDYNLTNIISVAASDQDDILTSFSNYGAKTVDVAAPGENIYSTVPFRSLNEDFTRTATPGFSGTNFSETGNNSKWGTALSAGGGYAAYGDLNNYPYQANSNGELRSDPVDSHSQATVMLQYDYTVQTENDPTCRSDYLATDVWDGSQWQRLERICGKLTAGTSYINVTKYRNRQMRVRFRWITNSSDNNYFGAAVDNVMIIFPDDANGRSYEYMDGTSMATPYVVGLAALLKSYRLNLTPAELKEIIIDSVDRKSSLRGKVASGGRINAYEALRQARSYYPSTDDAISQPGISIFSRCEGGQHYDQTIEYDDSQVCFRWNRASGGAGIVGYYVHLTTSPNSDARRGNFQTGTLFKPSVFSESNTYYVYLRAVDSDGKVSEQRRTQYRFTLPAVNQPRVIIYSRCFGGVKYSANRTYHDSQVCFRWPLVTGGAGVIGYFVNLSTNPDSNAQRGSFQIKNYIKSQVYDHDKTYYAYVQAVDRDGNLSEETRTQYQYELR
ncbi:MAG: S8 family peptidase [Patescibacteria group bacterium]